MMERVNLDVLNTEQRNEKTKNLDSLSVLELLQIMNEEDGNVVAAVKQELPVIEAAVKQIVAAIDRGGRLIYIGAGTSGRLGVLDASECPPTFSTTDEILGIMAGGDEAIRKAKEGAEDDLTLAEQDLKALNLNANDVLCGIAASGRTPYVIGGLKYMKSLNGTCIALSCNANSEISGLADIAIEVKVGPEILTGSTRLKAGTAQKLVLNMLSTASMVQLGKVFQNLMVDVKPSNLKLIERCKRIVMQACECSYEDAAQALEQCEFRPKTAIVMLLLGVDAKEAMQRLQQHRGFIRSAIQ